MDNQRVDQRKLGRAGISEDDLDALLLEEIEEGTLSGHDGHGLGSKGVVASGIGTDGIAPKGFYIISQASRARPGRPGPSPARRCTRTSSYATRD